MASTEGKQEVRVEQVVFTSAGVELTGNLYHPASEAAGPLPAVVVTGAWGTVKEQMAALYASEMAKRGFLALTFDFRSWGASGGSPRSMEDPFAKAEDIEAAAEFLATRPDADRSALSGLGVCASAAYLATAATKTSLFSSIALVAPALPSKETVVATIGGEAGVEALRKGSAEAHEQFVRTGREVLVPSVPPADDQAPAVPGGDYYSNPERGAVPEWDNTFNPTSWDKWLEYDAQASASLLDLPVLVMHSDAGASPESVREFVAKASGRIEQVWLDNVTQFDFYDQPEPVKTATDAAARHFTAHTRATN
ncbi:alpha/beta hydrolase [Lentzea sp. NPDC051838]|uniref:alpha/beta hydrolase n=1 Tax=Lentzea sp. NPDC051838 TaxID=3154849 RepID=UPI00343F1074